MIGPTPVQNRTLDAIRRLSVGGVAPTIRELQAELGVSNLGSVHETLRRLRDRGVIEWTARKARSIRILGDMDGLEKRSAADLKALKGRIEEILRGRGN